jgi:hypothetical protein
MTYAADERVDAYIDALPDWQQAICRQVRDLVHAADPEVSETIKRRRQPYFVLQGNICALLEAPEGRRGPRRQHQLRPGRAPGERLFCQRDRIAPRTPALRTSHSRTCSHPTIPAGTSKAAGRAPRGQTPGLPALPAPRGRRDSGVTGRPQAPRERDAQHP